MAQGMKDQFPGFRDGTVVVKNNELEAAAQNAMTTFGDTDYGGTNGVPTRLAGNTSTAEIALTQQGTGVTPNAPTWGNGFRHIKVTVPTAGITGMFAAPVAIIPAPGANLAIVVHDFSLVKLLNTTAFASGGATQLQYGNTVNAGGTAIGATVAATFVNNVASVVAYRGGSDQTSLALTGVANTGVYISNATGAFTTGDGSMNVDVWYSIVPTV